MGEDLQRIEAFCRWFMDASSTRTAPSRFGTALYHDDYPDRWLSNALRVEGSVHGATPSEVAAEADRLFSDSKHRTLFVESDEEGTRLAAGLAELDYETDRLVYQALRRDPDREPPPHEVSEVGFEQIRDVNVHANLRGHAGMTRDVAEMLADFSRELVDRVGARFFATSIDGRVVGYCELYVHDGMAQIEDVNTRTGFEGRGVARAFLTAAIGAARDAGAELIFLVADDADWPKQLYAKLGFDEVGHFREFIKPPPGQAYR
jgi:ribosomal protein S18 acetylase RimI-like enzyme